MFLEHGRQYHHFLGAHATCNKCGFKFYVRAEKDKVWENQAIVEKRVTPWKPYMKTVYVERKQSKQEFIPITQK
jgi:hypothetical protein